VQSVTIALTPSVRVSKLAGIVMHLKPETESRLQELAPTTGRAPDELVEDAMAGYLTELAQVRNMLAAMMISRATVLQRSMAKRF
jgi:D-arabinose 5-phosphate isomerase GutQ